MDLCVSTCAVQTSIPSEAKKQKQASADTGSTSIIFVSRIVLYIARIMSVLIFPLLNRYSAVIRIVVIGERTH